MKKCTLIFCLSSIACFGQIEMTKEKWNEDLAFLHQKLESRHANLYHEVTKEHFIEGINYISKIADSISDKQLIIRISELIAKVGDAHTWLHPGYQPRWKFKQLPIKFKYFEDGLFIVDTDEIHKSLLGSKLVSINSIPITDIIPKVSRIGYNENKFTRLISAERFIVYPEVLKRFGFIDSTEKILLELESKTTRNKVTLLPKLNEDIRWVNYLKTKKELPLVYKNQDSIYSITNTIDNKMLYIQLNSCTENEYNSFENLSEKIIEYTKKQRPKKLVLDIRRNVGGNSQLVYPLVYALMNYQKQIPDGQLFVVIGRWTLSASIILCAEIRKFCNPIFIGEPTGAKPNLYGENSYRLTLPNSELSISYSSEWFQPYGPFIDEEWVAPDIYIPIRSEHYFGLQQPIIEEITKYEVPQSNISKAIFELAINDSIQKAVKLYEAFKENPKNKFRNVSNDIRRMASKLGRNEKFGYSKIFYELVHEHNPENVLILVNLAQLYEDLKNIEKAKEFYEQTLSLLEIDTQTDHYLKHYIEDYVVDRLTELNNQ